MLRVAPLPLVIVAACIAYACGPHQQNEHQNKRAAVAHMTHADSLPIASSLDVRTDNGVDLSLDVANATKKGIEIDFPSGQTHEFVVLDARGKEVWRWSDGHFFTQALRNTPLSANESASYTEHWDATNMHGTFTAVAQLRSQNYPLEQRVQFTLP